MTTYLISNAVTWIGLTSFHAGDQVIVTPGAALVMPEASLSDLGAGAATAISFAGYVYLHDLTVDADVTFGITATGQMQSATTGAALALQSGYLDTAGQITAAHGTAVAVFGAGGLGNAGRIAGLNGVLLAGSGQTLANSGMIEGVQTALTVTGGAMVTNLGTIGSAGTAVEVTTGAAFVLVNGGMVLGNIHSGGASADQIRNAGTILGNVDLGAGADRFGGGHLQGDLAMGLGNDWVDARGNAVSGVIRDAGGADHYLIDSAQTRIADTGAGFDTVDAWCSYRLAPGLEALVLMGALDLTGAGNGAGNRLTGNAGNNGLGGGGGADVLAGGDGADTLRGGLGNDTLSGGAGDDVLHGDPGRDVLTGGLGCDSFVFATLADSSAAQPDLITDFQHGDRIDLSGVHATSFLGTDGFSHAAGQVRFVQAGGETQVQVDVNGDGLTDLLIRLTGLHDVTAGDFGL
jgi:serralysin